MEFKTEVQQACYDRVAPLIRDLFGEFAVVHEDRPCFGITYGSAFAEACVLTWGDDETIISVRSYVVTGVTVTQDLAEYLLRENETMTFGGFAVDDDGDIAFQYRVVGESCDKRELRAAMMAVATTADEYGQKIVARWGGQTWRDRRG